jgi:hypothetical protein
MSKFNRYMKIFLSTIAGVTLFVMAVQSGTGALERRPTDDESERLTIREAKKLANGEHSYGIVEYTHYPNGPQYVLALMVKGGIEDRMRLRAAPLVFSALGVALLGFCVCMTGASLILSALGIVGVASLLWQPGVIQWMGALYGNSYSLAICMAAAGVSLLPGGSSWPVFILGFLSIHGYPVGFSRERFRLDGSVCCDSESLSSERPLFWIREGGLQRSNRQRGGPGWTADRLSVKSWIRELHQVCRSGAG